MIKKIIRIVIALVVIGLVIWSVTRLIKSKDLALDPCATDVAAVIMPDLEGRLTSDRAITQAMFDHYFSYYVDRPGCLASSLKSSKLVSIGTIKHTDDDHFIADITFDLQPTSLADSGWATPETSTTTDGWIKNKKGSLSIRHASSTYYLVL